jgi:hypothetical protein
MVVVETIPNGRTATARAKDLGPGVRGEYIDLREQYKREGLTPKEARERAYVECEIGPRWADWRQRQKQQELLGSAVPLTPAEMEEVMPEYQRPSLTRAESIGTEEMSFVEQVHWAKRTIARVKNGEDLPRRFPNDGALFWYQCAVSNYDKFLGILQKVEAPVGEADNLYLQDSQYRFSEIEKQLAEAVREVGAELVAMESGFLELMQEVEA